MPVNTPHWHDHRYWDCFPSSASVYCTRRRFSNRIRSPYRYSNASPEKDNIIGSLETPSSSDMVIPCIPSPFSFSHVFAPPSPNPSVRSDQPTPAVSFTNKQGFCPGISSGSQILCPPWPGFTSGPPILLFHKTYPWKLWFSMSKVFSWNKKKEPEGPELELQENPAFNPSLFPLAPLLSCQPPGRTLNPDYYLPFLVLTLASTIFLLHHQAALDVAFSRQRSSPACPPGNHLKNHDSVLTESSSCSA